MALIMERVTVAELANEFNVQNQVVLSVLKKLGIFVPPSPSASVDAGFAERARKELQKQLQQVKPAEEPAPKKPAKAAKPKEPVKGPRKGIAKPAMVEEEPKPATLAPRKGKLKATDYAPAAAEEKPTKAAVIEMPRPAEVRPRPEKVEKKEAAVAAPPQPVIEKPIEEQPAEKKEAPPAEKVVPARPAPPPAPPKVEAPPPPKPKPQILKQSQAEAAPVAVEITERIFKIPALKPVERPAEQRKRRQKERPSGSVVIEGPRPTEPAEVKLINLTEGLTVKELAERINVKVKDLIARLFQRGIVATINQTLDGELIKQVCRDFGYEVNLVSFEEELAALEAGEDRLEDHLPRPPVVTIMGHVDHGKTTLLDAVRKSRITEQEHGGITQHIGAYKVEIKERSIVFLDTPGHEAFTLMRARGAQVTDIVVLVVAADDGVMPQTVEAIDHARAAGVPIVVAINKMDKPGAQPEKVKQQLSDLGLVPEEWGGDTVMVQISAKTLTNIDLLLEMILLVADLKELKANPKRRAVGTVLEARLDRTRGPVATVLVQNGTLRIGDVFLAGAVYGKVRAMIDDRGRMIKEAAPATPVEVLGLQGVPQAGDKFLVVDDIEKAKRIAVYRQMQMREKALRKSARLTLNQLYEQMREGKVKELPLILKADVQGSVEALTDALNRLSTEKVKIKILHSGVGAITESDVLLASASNAIIIGFNVRPERKATELAEQEGVDIRLHTIIYDVMQEIRNAMVGLLEVTTRERFLGAAEVRQTFSIPKVGTVAGAYVTSGVIRRGAEIRLLRDNAVVYQGKVSSLRRFKEDVEEVRSGFECGIGIENYNDLKVGDVIEAYVVEKVQPTASQL